ncbi:hypothetical protein D3C78_1773810 [compost metagenome]
MVDLLDAEVSQQVDGEHLRAERLVEVRVILQATKIGDAELAVTVNRGGAIQVADFSQLLWIGLASFCQRRQKPVEIAQATVGP